MLITEESEVHIFSDETTLVVDSGASYHLTPDRKCFSTYRAGDHGFGKMGHRRCVLDNIHQVQTTIERSATRSGGQIEPDINQLVR